MRDRLAVKNGIITLVCQLCDVILGFVVRKIFIEYIGVEMLGVHGTFSSLLNTLSLAELGFESAVIYSLYKPMRDNNRDEIEDIVSILKRIYEGVGVFVALAGIVVSFFLPSILKGVDVNRTIYLAFYLFLAGNVVTYFLAYKKSFLLAQQKDYVRNIYMSVYKTAATILQIVLILSFHSFVLYVGVSIVQNFLTNYSIARYVDKHYEYSFHKKINKEILRKILGDVKDIFFGRLAGYVYSSTDNLIISACVNTASVGLLGNYTQILYQLKNVINNVFISTKPIVGHFLTQDTNKEHTFQILKNYTFVRYAASVGLFVPGFVLCDCFINAWVGEAYVLSKVISLLLVTDIYIHFVHGALVDYIAGLGYFALDRNISIIGAIMNITISLLLVHKIGIVGVLVGTVVSQSFFWISRSIVIFRYYFEDLKVKLFQYWATCVGYTIVFFALCYGCRMILEVIPMSPSYFKFVIGGITSYLVIIPVVILLFSRTEEFAYFLNMIKNKLLKKGK